MKTTRQQMIEQAREFYDENYLIHFAETPDTIEVKTAQLFELMTDFAMKFQPKVNVEVIGYSWEEVIEWTEWLGEMGWYKEKGKPQWEHSDEIGKFESTEALVTHYLSKEGKVFQQPKEVDWDEVFKRLKVEKNVIFRNEIKNWLKQQPEFNSQPPKK